jgi:hypothetical protein
MGKKLAKGDQWFNEQLSAHYGHKVEIVRYTDSLTGVVLDYQLKCMESDCDDPVGIAIEYISDTFANGADFAVASAE